MKDPVRAHDKFVYEREVILAYLEAHRKSPITEKHLNARLPIESSLKPQMALKNEIQAFVEANKELLGETCEGDGDGHGVEAVEGQLIVTS